MAYFVYILRNPQGKLYIGNTNNIANRIKLHRYGVGSLFTKQYKNFSLVYAQEYPTRMEAMHREKQIKGWTKAKKEALILGNYKRLKEL